MSTAAAVAATPEALLERDVLAAARGDAGAFGRLVEETKSTVCSISLAIVRNLEASEDVAQEVYLAAWQGLAKLRNPASFLPWLRQLTRNQAHKYLRTQIRRRKRLESREDELLAEAADPAPAAPETLARREEQDLVRQVLDELPDEAREVITLFYREGRSVRQVSVLLDLSEAAVRQRLSRARKKVREGWLERAAEAFRASAPGTAFTSAVLTAVTAAAPASASVGLGLAGKAGSSLLGKVGTVLGAALLPAAIALSAAELNYRKLAAGSRNDEERRRFRRLRQVSAAAILLTSFGLPLSWMAFETWWAPVVVYLGLLAVLFYNTFFWVPSITAARLAEEVRRDPSAARRHRLQRWKAAIACILGAVGGGLGLAFGILGSISG